MGRGVRGPTSPVWPHAYNQQSTTCCQEPKMIRAPDTAVYEEPRIDMPSYIAERLLARNYIKRL